MRTKQKNTARNVALIPAAFSDFEDALAGSYNLNARSEAYHALRTRLKLAGVPTGPRSLFVRYVLEVNNGDNSIFVLRRYRADILERAVSNYRRAK